LPNVQFVDASPIYWEQRQVKTQYEQKIVRELCAILVKGVNAGLNFLREGVSEIDVHQVMWKTFLEAGLHDCPMGGRIMQHGGKHRYDLMIVPPTGANMGFSIFIDSSRQSISPSSTTLPCLTSTLIIFPAMGTSTISCANSHSPFCALLASPLPRPLLLTASPISDMTPAKIINTKNTVPKPIPLTRKACDQSTSISSAYPQLG